MSVLFDLFLLRRASSASVNLAFFLCPRGNLKIIQRNVIFSKANIKFSRLFWLTSVASLVYFPFDWFTNGDNIKFTIHYQFSRKTFSALQWQTCPMDGHLEPTKEIFRTCNLLPFSCTHLALWRGKEEGLKLWLTIWEERKLDFTKGVSLFQLKSM